MADAQNHRVLIWNSIPTTNEQPADVVLGQNNFTDAVELDPIKANITIGAGFAAHADFVTSDGVRLYVTDLGLNRVLIWNTIPSRNHQPADVVIGQKDFTTHLSNNVVALCDPVDNDRDKNPDKDADGNLIYPFRCGKTMNFPALRVERRNALVCGRWRQRSHSDLQDYPHGERCACGRNSGAAGRVSERGLQLDGFVPSAVAPIGGRHYGDAHCARMGWKEPLRSGSQQSPHHGVHRRRAADRDQWCS